MQSLRITSSTVKLFFFLVALFCFYLSFYAKYRKQKNDMVRTKDCVRRAMAETKEAQRTTAAALPIAYDVNKISVPLLDIFQVDAKRRKLQLTSETEAKKENPVQVIDRVWVNVGRSLKENDELDLFLEGMYAQVTREDATVDEALSMFTIDRCSYITLTIEIDETEAMLQHPSARHFIAAEEAERHRLQPSVDFAALKKHCCSVEHFCQEAYDPDFLEKNLSVCDSFVFSPHHNLPFTVNKHLDVRPSTKQDIKMLYGEKSGEASDGIEISAPYVCSLGCVFVDTSTFQFVLKVVGNSIGWRNFPTTQRIDAVWFQHFIHLAKQSTEFVTAYTTVFDLKKRAFAIRQYLQSNKDL